MKLLNGRELEIIKHTASGYTAKEIAKMIGIDLRTVQQYVENIRRKLAARNTSHAVYLASRAQILDDNLY